MQPWVPVGEPVQRQLQELGQKLGQELVLVLTRAQPLLAPGALPRRTQQLEQRVAREARRVHRALLWTPPQAWVGLHALKGS